MTLRVLEGTPGDGRLEAVARLLLERVATGRADSVAMITASEVTRRRALDRLHRQSGAQGFFDAPIFTLASFVERLHLTRPVPGTRLSSAEKEVLLAELARHQPAGARELLLATPGTIRAAARFITRLKRLGIYQSAQARASIPALAQRTPLLLALLALLDRYQQVLERSGLYDDEGIFIEATDPHRRAELQLDAVVPRPELLLVSPLPRTAAIERAVLARLFELFQETVVTLDHWPSSAPDTPLGCLDGERDWLAAQRACFERSKETPRAGAELCVLRQANRAREIEAIACTIAALPEPETAAIVVLDEDRYLPLIEEILPRHGLSAYVPSGFSLAQNPMFAPVAALLDLLQSGLVLERVEALFTNPLVAVRSGDQMASGFAHELFALLRGARIPPRAACPLEEWRARIARSRAHIAIELASMPQNESGARQRVGQLLDEQGERLLGVLAQLPDPDRELSAAEFVEQLASLLAILSLEQAMPADRGEHERAALERLGVGLSAVLDGMRSYQRASTSAHATPRPVREHAALLCSLLERSRCRSRRPLAAVTVLAARDIAGAAFDHVFVPGLTEDAFPVAAERDLFLGEADAAALELKTTRERLREAYHQLATLVGETRARVMLTHPRREGLRELLPSMLITAGAAPGAADETRISVPVALERVGDRWRRAREGGRLAAALSRTLAIPAAALLRGAEAEHGRTQPEVGDFDGVLRDAARADAAQQILGGRAFSPRAFDAFGHCPMKFLFAFLLGIDVEQDVEPELTPLDRGNLVHRILQRFYSGGEGARLAQLKGTPAFLAQARERLRQLTSEAVAELPHHGVFRARAEADLRRGLDGGDARPGSLATFLAIETGALRRTRPLQLEASFGLPPREAEGTLLQREPVRIELGAASGAFAILVRGRIDRIDGDADGRRILLDYKTGQERNRPKQSAHGINFQLPLYYLAMRTVPGQPVIGACYIDLLPGEVVASVGDQAALAAAGVEAASMAGLTAALDRYLERLQELKAIVLQGRFHTTHLDFGGEPCRNCHLRPACRGTQDRDRIAALAAAGHAFPALRADQAGGVDA